MKTTVKDSKHLTFYLGAIAFVIILFTLVTSYGEGNLKASIKVEGSYNLESLKSKLNCGEKPLQLIIEQSGIYLNSALIPLTEPRQNPRIQISELSGKLDKNQLFLSGKPHICASAIAIKAEFINKTLTGKISANNTTIDFIATQIDASDSKPKPH
jgi:hypothetical protein